MQIIVCVLSMLKVILANTSAAAVGVAIRGVAAAGRAAAAVWGDNRV